MLPCMHPRMPPALLLLLRVQADTACAKLQRDIQSIKHQKVGACSNVCTSR